MPNLPDILHVRVEGRTVSRDAHFCWSLPVAMRHGRRAVTLPTSLRLQRAAVDIQHVLVNYLPGFDFVPLLPVPPVVDKRRAAGVGVCFTGGVDSWYTLLQHSHEITHLFHVSGPGPLQHPPALLREIAQEFGASLVCAQTNLREVCCHSVIPWTYYISAALSGLAMCFSDILGTLLVSGQLPDDAPRKCLDGTQARLDPLWSTEYLNVRHVGQVTRLEKLRVVSAHPLARETLRVCFTSRDPRVVNCGRCEKCLRTMAELQCLGLLDQFPTFPHAIQPIAKPIDGSQQHDAFWEELR